jgi:hypothetical protein
LAQDTYDRKAKLAAIARSNAGTGAQYQSGFQYLGMEPKAAVKAGEAAREPEWKKAMARSYAGQREVATAEQEQERQRMEQRAKERLANQGFGTGSGLQEKVLSQLDIESSKALSGRLGQIDIAEAAAMGDRQSQFDLAAMQNSFAEGRIRLQDSLSDENATAAAEAESWFARGQAQEDMPQEQLSALQASNPRAYAAYMSGKAGRSYDDWKRSYDTQTQYRNALIMRLDPKSTSFVKDLNNIFTSLEYEGTLIEPPGGKTGGKDYTGYTDEELAIEYARASLGLKSELGSKYDIALEIARRGGNV